jgi:hypothetical protein
MRVNHLGLWAILFSIGGCAHHTVQVKCDGPLRPINQPAPKEAPSTPAAATRP